MTVTIAYSASKVESFELNAETYGRLVKLAEQRRKSITECIRDLIVGVQPGGSGWAPPSQKRPAGLDLAGFKQIDEPASTTLECVCGERWWTHNLNPIASTPGDGTNDACLGDWIKAHSRLAHRQP